MNHTRITQESHTNHTLTTLLSRCTVLQGTPFLPLVKLHINHTLPRCTVLQGTPYLPLVKLHINHTLPRFTVLQGTPYLPLVKLHINHTPTQVYGTTGYPLSASCKATGLPRPTISIKRNNDCGTVSTITKSNDIEVNFL